MRKKIIAANWKMNLNYAEAMALAEAVAETLSEDQGTEVILAPPYIYLNEVVTIVKNHSLISVASQNCSDKAPGAFTGEVSPAMLASIGVDYVIIGHSERRSYFNEDNVLLADKVKLSIKNSLLPIYCCGETLDQRKSEKHFEVVKKQIEAGLFSLGKKQIESCLIAYEPVWAIGTGITAKPAQAQEMHKFIRQLITDKFGKETGEIIPILYGGSVTPKNSAELFSCSDVDGALVGGASLRADDFVQIVTAMEKCFHF